MSISGQLYLDARKRYSRPQAVLFSETPGTFYEGNYYPIPTGYEYGSDVPSGESETFLILSDHNRSSLDLTPGRIQKRERMVNGRMRSWQIADKKSLRVSWSMIPSRSYLTEPLFSTDVERTITNIVNDQVGNVSTVTVTATGHDYEVGDVVTISSVNPTQFNFSKVEILESDTEEETFVFETIGFDSVYISGGTVIRSDVGIANIDASNAQELNTKRLTVDGGAGGMEMLDWYENHTGPFYVFLAYDKYNNLQNEIRTGYGVYNEVLEMYITDFSYNVIKRNAGITDQDNNTFAYDFWDVSITLEEA